MGLMINLAAIQRAADRLPDLVRRTPLVASTVLSDLSGATVCCKAENLQRTGAFKIRGALNKLADLADSGCLSSQGVTTGSAGNHAQALALAARHHSVPCRIYVPAGASISKVEACHAFGAEVIESGDTLAEAVEQAYAYAAATGAEFCHPFDDPQIVTGQGTLGLEVAQDLHDLHTVVIPLGGGGLAAGAAIAIKSLHPSARVIGVQAEICAPYMGSEVPTGPILTLADGIAVKYPGQVTEPLVRAWVDEIVTVDEDMIADAMVLLMEKGKLYVEGAGAVGVAALIGQRFAVPEAARVCVVLSGGNVDLGVVPGLIRRRETQAGRRLAFFARIDDRPGGLAQLLTVFAQGGANLIEVEHQREGIDLHVRETGVHATFEIRGRAHGEALIATAAAAGYTLEIERQSDQRA
jgi:threonine dehydratase